MVTVPRTDIAIWVLTLNGLSIARTFQQQWPEVKVFASKRLVDKVQALEAIFFDRLADAVEKHFHRFRGHIFIMATGIVVRTIASHLQSKLTDPAVVAMDDRATFAVSLVSGHLGGANRLTDEAARVVNATPVITTATDVNQKPAIDLLAGQRGLKIENPSNIKSVNMALLTGDSIAVHDPDHWLGESLPGAVPFSNEAHDGGGNLSTSSGAGVWVGDGLCDLQPHVLVLRPPSLVAGIGCNRNTPRKEIGQLLHDVMKRFHLSIDCLTTIASIDLKADEPGLCALAVQMDLTLQFFTKDELTRVKGVLSPSAVVAKHIGVPSVCEAAAILSGRHGRLIVPKQKTGNVTVAIARTAFMSSASVPEIPHTFPSGPEKS